SLPHDAGSGIPGRPDRRRAVAHQGSGGALRWSAYVRPLERMTPTAYGRQEASTPGAAGPGLRPARFRAGSAEGSDAGQTAVGALGRVADRSHRHRPGHPHLRAAAQHQRFLPARVAHPVRHGQGPQRHRELDVHRRPVPRRGRAAPTRIQYGHGRHRTRRRRVPARPRHRPPRAAAVAGRLLCAAAPGRTGAGEDDPVPDHHTAEERFERRRTRTHRTRDLGGAVNAPTTPAGRQQADANASSAAQTLSTAEAGARNGFLRWFMPELPLARVAVFRVFIYIFIIIDVLTISGDVIAHGWTPEFYQPLWLARVLHIPAVSVP